MKVGDRVVYIGPTSEIQGKRFVICSLTTHYVHIRNRKDSYATQREYIRLDPLSFLTRSEIRTLNKLNGRPL